MTRDLKEEILKETLGKLLGPWGTQYDHINDIWYVFPLRNGDCCVSHTTTWENETQAREYVDKINSVN